jgi:hypothetical protein
VVCVACLPICGSATGHGHMRGSDAGSGPVGIGGSRNCTGSVSLVGSRVIGIGGGRREMKAPGLELKSLELVCKIGNEIPSLILIVSKSVKGFLELGKCGLHLLEGFFGGSPFCMRGCFLNGGEVMLDQVIGMVQCSAKVEGLFIPFVWGEGLWGSGGSLGVGANGGGGVLGGGYIGHG